MAAENINIFEEVPIRFCPCSTQPKVMVNPFKSRGILSRFHPFKTKVVAKIHRPNNFSGQNRSLHSPRSPLLLLLYAIPYQIEKVSTASMNKISWWILFNGPPTFQNGRGVSTPLYPTPFSTNIFQKWGTASQKKICGRESWNEISHGKIWNKNRENTRRRVETHSSSLYYWQW